MDLTVGVVLSALGLAGLLGGAAAVFRTGMANRTIELWKEEAAVLATRLDTQEHLLAEEQTRTKALETKVESLERERDTLTDIATGRSAVEGLTEIIMGHHAQMLKMQEQVLQLLSKMTEERRGPGRPDPPHWEGT